MKLTKRQKRELSRIGMRWQSLTGIRDYNVSKLREKLKSAISMPVAVERGWHDKHAESARRVSEMTLNRIVNSPSAPLPLETSLLLGSQIDENGFVTPFVGFTERDENAEDA